MFNKCNFPYKWVESGLGCLKIVMFTKLANYLQRVEVINFQITIDARNALQEIMARRRMHSHWMSRAVLIQYWRKISSKLESHIINVLINNPVNVNKIQCVSRNRESGTGLL